MTDPSNNRKDLPSQYHQGYCYFDVRTGKFYIDISDVTAPSSRMALNAERADQDHLGNTIYETYGQTLGYDLTEHEIQLKNGEGHTIGDAIKLGALADANAVSTTYQPAGTNTTASLTIYPTTANVLHSVSNAGAFPTLTGTVDSNGVLNLSMSNDGRFPQYATTSVWTGYSTTSYAAAPIFSGTTATITLNPMEGAAQNGDNVDF